jgi:hypothetical protein
MKIWGGTTFAVISVEGETLRRRDLAFLRRHDPDWICAFPRFFRSAQASIDELREELPLIRWPGSHPQALSPHFPHTAGLRVVELSNDGRSPESLLPVVDRTSGAEPLVEMAVAAIVGLMTPKEAADAADARYRLNVSTRTIDIRSAQNVPADTFSQLTYAGELPPVEISFAQLSNYHMSLTRPLIVVVGKETGDWQLFWNYRAVTGRPLIGVYWLIDDPRLRDACQMALFDALSVHAGTTTEVIVTSSSLPESNALQQVSTALQGLPGFGNLTIRFCAPDTLPTESLGWSRTWEWDNGPTENIDVQSFMDGAAAGLLPMPYPRSIDVPRDQSLQWMADVQIERLRPPLSPAVTPLLMQSGDRAFWRASTDGVAYFANRIMILGGYGRKMMVVKPKLLLPGDDVMLGQTFEAHGHQAELSDKGQVEREWIRVAGGLSAAADDLIDRDVRNLLLRFVDQSPNEAGRHTEGVLVDRVRYLDLVGCASAIANSIDGLVREAAQAAGLDPERNEFMHVKELLDSLVSRRLITRGFVVKCSWCRRADWHSIESVSERTRCRRCSRETSVQAEATPYFKLDGVLWQGLVSKSHATVLTLNSLRRRALAGFHFTTASDVHLAAGSKVELDFCVSIDGSVGVGEAKCASGLSSSDRGQLRNTVSALQTLPIRFFVLSTDQSAWSASDMTFIEHSIVRPLRRHGIDSYVLAGPDIGWN